MELTNLKNKRWPLAQIIDDPKQLLRLRRMSLALIGGLALNIFCFIFLQQNLLRMTTIQFIYLSSIFWFINLLFLLSILTGFNRMMKDPSLTIPQMVWAITSTMIAIYFTNELRSVLLMLCLLVFIFGGLYLTSSILNFIIWYSILCYIIVIYFLMQTPSAQFTLKNEVIVLIVYSMVALCYSTLATEMIGLRSYNKNKVKTLETNLIKSEAESVTDELTGIGNRRFLMSLLDRQRLMSSRKDQYHFAVNMVDIDHFKNINDHYGHAVGDLVIQEFSKIIQNTLRKVDYFCRMSGDEFIIVEPFTNLEQSLKTAERIQHAINNANFEHIAPGLNISASIGVSVYQWPEEITLLLKRLDEAMYSAKKNGRNQISIL